MPELPEIRAHAERLNGHYAGLTIEKFEPISFSVMKTFDPNPNDAIGSKLDSVGSRGKFLLLRSETLTFAVHLMQGGRLKPDAKLSRKPRGGLARWRFSGDEALLLTEAGTERKAGVWALRPDFDPEGEPFDGLGIDADQLDASEFAALCSDAGGVRLHGFLRDQRQLAGLGRRLANEICWEAKLSPFAPVGKLGAELVVTLFEAMQSCLQASLDDEKSRSEMVKSAQRLSNVHHREGAECPRCGDAIRAVEYKAYSVNYCANCQTNGKVLADNTTSKFLK